MLTRRIELLAELLISLRESPARSTSSSMFDWPEHRNTSPMRTSLTDWWAPELPCAVRTNGPPALIGGSSALQRPEASALARALELARETVTDSPAAAWPQTAIGRSRCSTA